MARHASFIRRSLSVTEFLLSILTALETLKSSRDVDQDVTQPQHGDQDDQICSVEVHPSGSTRQTDRAVYRIDPRTPEKDLRLDPRPDDQTHQPTRLLSRTTRQSKTKSQARTHFDREEPDSGHSLSLLARLVRTAHPDGHTLDDLIDQFDSFMGFDDSHMSKARILKLSEDLGQVKSSSVHDGSMITHADSPSCVLLLSAMEPIITDAPRHSDVSGPVNI
ncbi:Uncharacterized protein Rs2_21534 [Raphanus sativus]|nr:Uncharacterized protein Rs2_21534 [Raphanus sativus]